MLLALLTPGAFPQAMGFCSGRSMPLPPQATGLGALVAEEGVVLGAALAELPLFFVFLLLRPLERVCGAVWGVGEDCAEVSWMKGTVVLGSRLGAFFLFLWALPPSEPVDGELLVKLRDC